MIESQVQATRADSTHEILVAALTVAARAEKRIQPGKCGRARMRFSGSAADPLLCLLDGHFLCL